MYDQANDLRQLVRRAGPQRPALRTRLVVVAGGKGGSGTTTLAVNLAAALAAQGRAGGPGRRRSGRRQRRPALPAAPTATRSPTCWPDAARPAAGPANRSGRLEGPVAAAGARRALPSGPAAAQDRLIAQLQSLGPQADLAVIDAGNGPPHGFAHRFWQSADALYAGDHARAGGGDGRLCGRQALGAGSSRPPITRRGQPGARTGPSRRWRPAAAPPRLPAVPRLDACSDAGWIPGTRHRAAGRSAAGLCRPPSPGQRCGPTACTKMCARPAVIDVARHMARVGGNGHLASGHPVNRQSQAIHVVRGN